MIISKELLRKVLEIDTINDYEFDSNLITIYYIDDENRKDYGLINIHELAHKYKEWALNEGYELIEGSDVTYVYSDNTGNDCFSASTPNKDFDIERVFKCCEWILEQKAKS